MGKVSFFTFFRIIIYDPSKLRPCGLRLDIFAENSRAKIASILKRTILINREDETISQFIFLWIKSFCEAGTGLLECHFVNLPFIKAPS